jgi:hypothetical protein
MGLRIALLILVLTALGVVAAANGHPGTPFRTVAEARAVAFNPGSGEFDDRSASCAGFGASQAGRFRHFRCITVRNDGLRFSLVLHTLAHGWDFGEVHCLSGPAKCSVERTVAQGVASGDFATAATEGDMDRPFMFEVRAFASPDQIISVHWNLVCSRGVGTYSRSGGFRDYSGMGRQVPRSPFYDRPDHCAVAAVASIRRGSLTLKIVGIR